MTEQIIYETTTQSVLAENISFADYLIQYEGQSTEWHAGKIVQKVTNNTRHNLIQHFLGRLLSWYLERTDTGLLITAGMPMYVSDDVSSHEPDLTVVLNENVSRIGEQYIDGAVDLAVEIISPGTAATDRGAKYVEYEAAGVAEYWLIDPIRKKAYIHHLNDEGIYSVISSSMSDSKLLTSSLLKGFQLSSEILWRDKLPVGDEIVAMVQKMVENA